MLHNISIPNGFISSLIIHGAHAYLYDHPLLFFWLYSSLNDKNEQIVNSSTCILFPYHLVHHFIRLLKTYLLPDSHLFNPVGIKPHYDSLVVCTDEKESGIFVKYFYMN